MLLLNFVGMWRSNFTIAVGCCFEMSDFTMQGKANPSFVLLKIIAVYNGKDHLKKDSN